MYSSQTSKTHRHHHLLSPLPSTPLSTSAPAHRHRHHHLHSLTPHLSLLPGSRLRLLLIRPFYRMASNSEQLSTPPMSSERAQSSQNSVGWDVLFQTDSHLQPAWGSGAQRPTTSRGTLVYYCCQCRQGPQVWEMNPACYNCGHHANLSCCELEKIR